MTPFQKMMTRGMEAGEAIDPSVIVFKGEKPLPCSVNSVMDAIDITPGMALEEVSSICAVRKVLLRKPPSTNVEVVVDGRNFLIKDVKADSISWNLALKSLSQ